MMIRNTSDYRGSGWMSYNFCEDVDKLYSLFSDEEHIFIESVFLVIFETVGREKYQYLRIVEYER